MRTMPQRAFWKLTNYEMRLVRLVSTSRPATSKNCSCQAAAVCQIESGRALRHRLNHEFGPAIVKSVRDRAQKLTPLARSFLNTSPAVLAYLRTRWLQSR